MLRPCAGCPEVDDLPRIAVQSDDGQWRHEFHLRCGTDDVVAAAQKLDFVPFTALIKES